MAGKMSKLRKSAKGRECQIRIPGVCNGNPETVVLCHLPGGGMGAKSHDMFGAFGCHACHDVVDYRVISEWHAKTIELWFIQGVFRTQQIWLEEGLINV
jgi:hypothetical protein